MKMNTGFCFQHKDYGHEPTVPVLAFHHSCLSDHLIDFFLSTAAQVVVHVTIFSNLLGSKSINLHPQDSRKFLDQL